MNKETDVLVVKVNVRLRAEEIKNLHRFLCDSISTGVVILPPYCDAILVPKDVEVVLKNKEENE